MALVHFMGCLWFLGSLWTGIFLWNCAAGANPLDVQQNDTRQSGRAVGGINFDEGSRLSTSLKGTLDSSIPQGQLANSKWLRKCREIGRASCRERV